MKNKFKIIIASLFILGVFFSGLSYSYADEASNIVTLKSPLKNNINSIFGFIDLILTTLVIPIGGAVSVVMIIYSGFLFIKARGNEDELKKAKETLLHVVIGVAIVLGSLAISTALQNTVLSVTNLN